MFKKKILPAKALNKEQLEEMARGLKVAPLIAGVLMDRGFTDKAQMEEFLYGSKTPYHDPFLLQDMDRATERILQALRLKETITVYGDYDVDGITASSILYLFLQEQGAKVNVYIPRRDSEGYGLNDAALKTLADQGTTLVITVDSGISGAAEVAHKPAGLDMIITDHHMPPTELPKAFAVINPHRADDQYPFKDLAGVGVSFKLCQGLYQKITRSKNIWQENWDLVALGTIADMVPMTGENRELVRAGLKALRQTKNKGLLALMEAAAIKDKNTITAGTVGFVLAPRLNAVGRLNDAMDGVKLLTSSDAAESTKLAKMLNEENITRQGISQEIFVQADDMLKAQTPQEWGIVLYKEDWHPGVIGIAASRLVERYHLPVILLTKDGDKAKGSCRSIPPLNLYEALAGCKDYLIQFGGHKQAAGLTLDLDKVAAFRTGFQKQVKEMLGGKEYVPTIAPDYYFPADKEITTADVRDLALLEPCGVGNASAVFAFAKGQVLNAAIIGKEQEHLKLTVANGSYKYSGLLWHQGVNFPYFYKGETGALAFAPRVNSFQGRESVDLQVMAFNPEHVIVDYRYLGLKKNDYLKSVLQNSKKTVVYLSNTTDFPQELTSDKVVLKEPADFQPADLAEADAVVLYDTASAHFLTAQPFFLESRQPALYLCYATSAVDEEMTKLQTEYPRADGLRLCYKYLREQMTSGAVAKQDVLDKVVAPNVVLTSTVLKIFSELGFIREEDGKLKLASTAHNPLTNSETYNQVQKELEAKQAFYKKIRNITCEEIAALW